MDVLPPGLTGLDVAHDDEYVAGFPVHVALTLHGDPRAELPRLPRPDWRSLYGAVGLKLLDPAADEGRPLVFSQEAAPLVDDELRLPQMTIPAGGVVRMLVDLSTILGGVAHPPRAGAFHARITYAASPGPYLQREAGFALVVRAPSSLEEHVLEALAVDAKRGWGAWAREPPPAADAAHLTSKIAADDPLRFLRVLRFLMFGPVELRDVELSMFDVLTGVYAPEAEALRAEVLAARGDRVALAAQLAKVRAATPGLEPWLASIEQNASYVPWMRAHIRK
jgi:hypothetical protein